MGFWVFMVRLVIIIVVIFEMFNCWVMMKVVYGVSNVMVVSIIVFLVCAWISLFS